jgi:hypothetical protein
MLDTPVIPEVQTPDLLATLGNLPIQVELSPLVLSVLLLPVGIFVAALSVMLVYHWRRFPFEHELFRWVERVYLLGVLALFAIAVAGIILSA